MKIIVLNLPRDVKEPALAALFVPFAKIQSCSIVMDDARGMSKGFAFVEVPDEDEANAAIAALHGKQVGNQKIRVKNADAPRE